jgi:excisionase family DNA binding protein
LELLAISAMRSRPRSSSSCSSLERPNACAMAAMVFRPGACHPVPLLDTNPLHVVSYSAVTEVENLPLAKESTTWLQREESPLEPLLDYPGAAARLNTTERHIRALTERRELPFVKVGRLVRFRSDDLDAYVASRIVQPQRTS